MVDYSDPSFSVPLAVAVHPTDPAALAEHFLNLWTWARWVRIYAKPPQAVLAASRLAAAQGKPKAVSWMAPGTGHPLSSPGGVPGVAVLRCDWAAGPEEVHFNATEAQRQGLMLVVDESTTGLRLARGGACAAYGLQPDAVLWAPTLPGGRTLGLLAGRGEAPPEPEEKQLPGPEAREAAAVLLDLARREDIHAAMEALGQNLRMGLEYFSRRAGLNDEIALEGPMSLPRLTGRRVWAFMALAAEERLRLAPLVLFDPVLDQEDAQELVWPRLARACARLKVLPEGEMAPLGWRDAGPSTCRAAGDILKNFQS
ncbi:hypothetical protein FAK_32260 [Desulfoferula mesophila]|uniref:Uncharacterized protein n=1 Tax=Desulfoferula mesophila TaxID=3058419 RepID=A0AAU9EJI3_9BACT|nr:hypothetical protein FAK_32260 [Desulfoferula mesophilus]